MQRETVLTGCTQARRMWLDGRTLRPVKLDMTATAHFVHHRYTAFNAARRTFPPR